MLCSCYFNVFQVGHWWKSARYWSANTVGNSVCPPIQMQAATSSITSLFLLPICCLLLGLCFYHPIAGRHFEVWLPVFLWFPLKLKKLLQEIPFPFFTTALPYYQDISGSSGQRHQKQLTLDRVCGCVSVRASRPIKSVKQAAAGGVCLSFVSAVLSPACANSYLRPECDGGGGSRGEERRWQMRQKTGLKG